MKKSSMVALGVTGFLCILLVIAYLSSRSAPEQITREQAVSILDEMKTAVEKKNLDTVMDAVAMTPEGKYGDMTREQLRTILGRAFVGSSNLAVEISKVSFDGGHQAATLAFDVNVKNSQGGMSADDYKAHITLYLKRVEVSRLGGLVKAMDWKITKADSTGPNMSTFGEL